MDNDRKAPVEQMPDADLSSRAQATAKGGAARKRRKPVGLIALIVIVAVVLVGGGFMALTLIDKSRDEAGSQQAGQQTAQTQLAVESDSTQETSAAADGRIVMTLGGCADTLVLQGEDYIESGCRAVGRTEGDISDSVKVSGKVDTDKLGDYEVTYTATNGEGQRAEKVRTVHVVSADEMGVDPGDGIAVFMYHYVYTLEDQPDSLDGNYILDTDLAAQLAYLRDNGFYYPSFQELRAYVDGTHSLPDKSVILTFDDGSPGFLSYGIPLFEEYQVPVTSFLVAVDNVAPATQCPSEYVNYQSHSYDQHHAGGTIGHGGVVSAMSYDELVADLTKAAELIGGNEAYAYPYGDYTEDAQRAVRDCGILCAFTTAYDYVYPGDDPTCLSRIRISGGNSLESFIAVC